MVASVDHLDAEIWKVFDRSAIPLLFVCSFWLLSFRQYPICTEEPSPCCSILYDGDCDDAGDARWDMIEATTAQLVRLEAWMWMVIRPQVFHGFEDPN